MFSDPNGYTVLQNPSVMVNNLLTTTNSCFLTYVWWTDSLYLISDTNTQWLGLLTPGQAGTVEKSQCKVDGALSSRVGFVWAMS